MFASFIGPLFLPSLSLDLCSCLELPACSWECLEKWCLLGGCCSWGAKWGLWGGSVTLEPLAWSILALGGLCCLCHMGQPPSPLSSPSPQTQSQRSYSKHEEVLWAAASWKSGLVPYNHSITWTAFYSPLPFPPLISSRKAWAAANLSIISAFQSWLTVQVSHHLSLPLFFALF